jgi:hypothetical protein
VIAADVICGGNERRTLGPLVKDAEDELEHASVSDPVTVALADAGFWNTEQIQALTARGIRTLVSPDNRRRKPPGNIASAKTTTSKCANSYPPMRVARSTSSASR